MFSPDGISEVKNVISEFKNDIGITSVSSDNNVYTKISGISYLTYDELKNAYENVVEQTVDTSHKSSGGGGHSVSSSAIIQSEASKLVELLNIMQVSGNENVEVTRAEFAYYVSRIINVDEYAKNEKVYFKDVTGEYWAINCINTLVDMKAISVSENALFRPDDVITTEEAVKTILSVMGYDAYANVQGGYPTVFMIVANQLKLFDDVSINNKLTRASVAVFITNALNAELYLAATYGSDFIKYSQHKDKTLLSVYKISILLKVVLQQLTIHLLIPIRAFMKIALQ